MKNMIPSTETAELLDLGMKLGQRRAFSLVAGRCSAADAECLRQLREDRKYRSLGLNWGQFCSQQLHMSKAQADRVIQLLEEFGPGYFELAQLTRITAEQFRAIAPAVAGQTLRVNGEAIALIPENSGKVAAAVAELRRAAAPIPEQAPLSHGDRLAAIQQRVERVVTDFEALSTAGVRDTNSLLLASAVRNAVTSLQRLEQRIELHRRLLW